MSKPRATKITPSNCNVKLYLLASDKRSSAMEYLGEYNAVPPSHFNWSRLYSGSRYMDLTWKKLTEQLDLKPGRRVLMVADFDKARVYLT